MSCIDDGGFWCWLGDNRGKREKGRKRGETYRLPSRMPQGLSNDFVPGGVLFGSVVVVKPGWLKRKKRVVKE